MVSIIISTVALGLVVILLVLVTLLQKPKDEGQTPLGSTGLDNLVGVAQTSTLLEKITYFLAFLLVALVLTTSYLVKQEYGREEVHVTSKYLKQYEQELPITTESSTPDHTTTEK
ncbi:MAG: preprotein translocase subunit SecG [Bacteroidota bacterium]